jgi:hypothetical protein
MAVEVAGILEIEESEALEILSKNNFDLSAILGDDLVYEELGKDLEDVLGVLGEDLADFE